jgi:hypothetical protein
MKGKCERCGWAGEVEEAEFDFKNSEEWGHHFLRAMVCVDVAECLKRTSIEQPDMVSSG